MKLRFILSLILLATGLTLVEVTSVAQTTDGLDLNALINQFLQQGLGGTGGTTQEPTGSTPDPFGPDAGLGGAGGAAGIGGAGGTAGAAGSDLTGAWASILQRPVGQIPLPPAIPEMDERTETATAGQRVNSGRADFALQQIRRRDRTLTAGTVKPGLGLANRNQVLADALPPPHTVESVLAGRETSLELLSYTFVTTAVETFVTNLTAALALANPFDPLFGNDRTGTTTQPSTGQASKRLSLSRTKVQATADQLLLLESLREYNDEILADALEALLRVPEPAAAPTVP